MAIVVTSSDYLSSVDNSLFRPMLSSHGGVSCSRREKHMKQMAELPMIRWVSYIMAVVVASSELQQYLSSTDNSTSRPMLS